MWGCLGESVILRSAVNSARRENLVAETRKVNHKPSHSEAPLRIPHPTHALFSPFQRTRESIPSSPFPLDEGIPVFLFPLDGGRLRWG